MWPPCDLDMCQARTAYQIMRRSSRCSRPHLPIPMGRQAASLCNHFEMPGTTSRCPIGHLCAPTREGNLAHNHLLITLRCPLLFDLPPRGYSEARLWVSLSQGGAHDLSLEPLWRLYARLPLAALREISPGHSCVQRCLPILLPIGWWHHDPTTLDQPGRYVNAHMRHVNERF